MEGLYATLNLRTKLVNFNRFPYGTDAGRRELARLRHEVPPLSNDIVPDQPITSIAPEDRPLAYYFLRQASFSIVTHRPRFALPYFIAFSVLSKVRFSYIELLPETASMQISLTVIEDDDHERVRQNFLMLMIPHNATKH